MPSKKTSAKKTTTKKSTSKKPAVKKTTAPAQKAAKKAVKKATKQVIKKVSAKKAKTAVKGVKKSAKKKLKASDFLKRPSHTPAIFKPASKKPIPILFTLDDVQEVLKNRALQEEADRPKKKTARKVAKPLPPTPEAIEELDLKNSKHSAASLDDILGLGGPSINPVSGPGKVPRKWQKYHKLLEELRDEVRAELNMHSSDTLKRSQKEDAGDIATSVDAGTDTFDRDFALSLLSSEQEALNEIEAALKRVYNGTYGVCEETGEPINAERLEAVPFTRFSLEGQRQFESTSVRRISQAGAFLNESSGEPITFGDDDGDN